VEKHIREHRSLLAVPEKRLLIAIAHRLPRWVNSDHLTLLALAAMALAGAGYALTGWDVRARWLVVAALAVNWFGDSLDGTVARVRQTERPRYGFYVDHVVDMFGTFFLLFGLGLSGYMSLSVAMALIVVYYALSIEVYLTTYTIGTFHLSFWKFSPTELRILLCIGNLVLLTGQTHGRVGDRVFLLFDVGGAIGVVGMVVMLLWAAYRHTVHLYNEERLD